LELYCEANEVTTPEKKRAILLSCYGPKTYTVIRGLVAPSKPSEKSYEELKEIVGKHYSPPSSSIMHRLKFNTRVREKGESVASYVAALRQLAEFCEFERLNDMLRDRLVCGVNDEQIQRRLLSETDFTFESAMKLAQTAERAEKDTQELKQDTQTSSIHFHAGKKGTGTGQHTQIVCIRCGGDHLAPNCRFKHVECRACKKKGHLARISRSKPRKGPPKHGGQGSKPEGHGSGRHNAHYVAEEESESEVREEKDESYTMFNLSGHASDPIVVTVSLNNQDIDMIVDTGASKSIISEQTYLQLAQGCGSLSLEKSSA